MALPLSHGGQINIGHIGSLMAQEPGYGEVCVQGAHAAFGQFPVLLRRVGVPLRYNYDKPEKPRRIKGFEVFSLIFSSFSKPKNHTEISRIAGGVSLTTNE